MVGAHLRALLEVDVRALLPLIQVPTLVLHHRDFRLVPLAQGRYLADHIDGAGLLELPGDLPLWWGQRDLVAGSDVVLQDRGSRRLKGVEGDCQLFGVVGR